MKRIPFHQLKEMIFESLNDSKSIITEGGNVFKSKHGKPLTSKINQENIAATIDDIEEKILKPLKINPKDTAILGSAGKRLPGNPSGDIDLLIDASKIGLDFDMISKKITALLDKIGIDNEINSGMKIVHARWPIANSDGKQKNDFVQLDMMVSENFDFMKFSQSAPYEIEGEPYYKMTIRNAILAALAKVVDEKVLRTGIVQGEKQPVDVKRYSYNIESGLNYIHKIRNQKFNGTFNKTWKTISTRNVSTDPKEIVHILFGKKVSLKDVESPIGAWKAAKKSAALKDKDIYEKFLSSLKNELDRKVKYQGLEIPPEIEKEFKNLVKESLDKGLILYRVGNIEQMSDSKLGLFFSTDLNYLKNNHDLGSTYSPNKAKRYLLNPKAKIFDPAKLFKVFKPISYDNIQVLVSDLEKYGIEDECDFELDDKFGVTSTDGLALAGKELGYDGTIIRNIPRFNEVNGFDEYAIYNPEAIKLIGSVREEY